MYSDQIDKADLQLARMHRFTTSQEPRLDDYRGIRCGCFDGCCECCYLDGACFIVADSWYKVRAFCSLLFRMMTLWMLAMAALGTWLCITYQWVADLPLTLFASVIVFPVTFGIQFTLNRRERVLLDVGSLKSSALAMYVHTREWALRSQRPTVRTLPERMRSVLTRILKRIARYMAHREYKDAHIVSIYQEFDHLMVLVEEVREAEDWVKSVVSRLYQYCRFMMNDFERLRTVADYRTPSVFRSYAWIFIALYPIIFSPLFANYEARWGMWVSYYIAGVTTLMTALLYNSLDDLEDPFDGSGLDDLSADMIKEPLILLDPARARIRAEEIRAQHRGVTSQLTTQLGLVRQDEERLVEMEREQQRKRRRKLEESIEKRKRKAGAAARDSDLTEVVIISDTSAAQSRESFDSDSSNS